MRWELKPKEGFYLDGPKNCFVDAFSFASFAFISTAKALVTRLEPGVTVIWASPSFGHLHSQNPSDTGIFFSHYLGDLGQG